MLQKYNNKFQSANPCAQNQSFANVEIHYTQKHKCKIIHTTMKKLDYIRRKKKNNKSGNWRIQSNIQ